MKAIDVGSVHSMTGSSASSERSNVTALNNITVLCVDDHLLVREGIVAILNSHPGINVVGSVASGQEAIETYLRCKPDIVLMDLQLQSSLSGFEATRIITRIDQSARIIVLTVLEGDEDIARSLEAGATTYLLKDTVADDLIRVVRDVAAGCVVLPPDVASKLAERSDTERLTPREVEVLEFIVTGLRNKEIAAALDRSEDTIHAHVKHILHKLGVTDRSAAIATALRRGIIHLRS
jgi:DNA-binding NarL/FixJ family response regulator